MNHYYNHQGKRVLSPTGLRKRRQDLLGIAIIVASIIVFVGGIWSLSIISN